MSDFEKQVAAVFNEFDRLELYYKPSRQTLGKFFLVAVAANVVGYASLIGLGMIAKHHMEKKENNDG